MPVQQGETIAAIATAIVPQQGSVGIVRLSGAEGDFRLLSNCFMRPVSKLGRVIVICMAMCKRRILSSWIDEGLAVADVFANLLYL